MLTYVSARLNRVCVCVCVLGYSGVPGIAWYAPLLEPLFFSLLLWRKWGERERKEECSACVCDARAHTLAHTVRERKGTGNDGVRKEGTETSCAHT